MEKKAFSALLAFVVVVVVVCVCVCGGASDAELWWFFICPWTNGRANNQSKRQWIEAIAPKSFRCISLQVWPVDAGEKTQI